MLFIFAANRFWYNNLFDPADLWVHPYHVWADEVTESCSPAFLQAEILEQISPNWHENGKEQPFEDVSPIKNGWFSIAKC